MWGGLLEKRRPNDAGQKPQGAARYGVASMPPTPSAGALSDLRFSYGPSRTHSKTTLKFTCVFEANPTATTTEANAQNARCGQCLAVDASVGRICTVRPA